MNKTERIELNKRRGRAISRTMMKKFTDRDNHAQRDRAKVAKAVGSERELARLLGCSYSSIGEYFRGEVAIPKKLDDTFRLLFPKLTWWKWPRGVAE